MDDKTKKLIFFIGSLFVAIIFVTSYGAFGNNSSSSTTTSTISSSNTVLVYGTANGMVVNYSYSVYVTAASKAQLQGINATLDRLQANGTISNYVLLNATTYQAVLSTINLYGLSVYLANSLNATNISVGGYTYVRLPATINMYYSATSQVPVAFPQKNYTVLLNRAYPIGANVPLKVQVLVTTQGRIYNNQIRLSQG